MSFLDKVKNLLTRRKKDPLAGAWFRGRRYDDIYTAEREPILPTMAAPSFAIEAPVRAKGGGPYTGSNLPPCTMPIRAQCYGHYYQPFNRRHVAYDSGSGQILMGNCNPRGYARTHITSTYVTGLPWPKNTHFTFYLPSTCAPTGFLKWDLYTPVDRWFFGVFLKCGDAQGTPVAQSAALWGIRTVGWRAVPSPVPDPRYDLPWRRYGYCNIVDYIVAYKRGQGGGGRRWYLDVYCTSVGTGGCTIS